MFPLIRFGLRFSSLRTMAPQSGPSWGQFHLIGSLWPRMRLSTFPNLPSNSPFSLSLTPFPCTNPPACQAEQLWYLVLLEQPLKVSPLPLFTPVPAPWGSEPSLHSAPGIHHQTLCPPDVGCGVSGRVSETPSHLPGTRGHSLPFYVVIVFPAGGQVFSARRPPPPYPL